MVLIDPLPRAWIEMASHPLAVHQVHDKGPSGRERALDRFEHSDIILRPLEVAERVTQHTDAVKLGIAEAKAPRIALVERNREVALLGTLAGETDQIARSVEAGNMRKAAPGKLERMAALAAAQIENAIVALEPDGANEEVHFFTGVAVVLDHVAVGFEIERVEQGAPPVRGQMPLEVRYRPQGTRCDLSTPLRTIAIHARRARAGGVRLGTKPRTVRLFAHIHCPWSLETKRGGFPSRGTAKKLRLQRRVPSGIEAGQGRAPGPARGDHSARRGCGNRPLEPATAKDT